MSNQPSTPEVLLKGSEVAKLFRVHPKTVVRWAEDGKIASIRTPGGHRRYKKSDVVALLNSWTQKADNNATRS